MTTPSDAQAVDLPPLPEPSNAAIRTCGEDGFTADQMHAYLLADRAARAQAEPVARVVRRCNPRPILPATMRLDWLPSADALPDGEYGLYAAPVMPASWVPCTITYVEGEDPEEVAFGPQRMMDRLKKWLDSYFAMLYAQRYPAARAQGAGEAVDRLSEIQRLVVRYGEAEYADGLADVRVPSKTRCDAKHALYLALDAALTAPTIPQAAEVPGLPLAQEPKYTVNGSAIVNRASGEAIPADEPVFIFRARDARALYALKCYASYCGQSAHALVVLDRIDDFRRFKESNPARMKEPDTAPTPTASSPKACPHGDRFCPCPDGDTCHYEGANPSPAPKAEGEAASSRAAQSAEGTAAETFRIALHEWAVQGWRDEVQNRPLVNIYRKEMDGFWRKAIRKAGGDPDAVIGPDHDTLVAAQPQISADRTREGGDVDSEGAKP